MAKFTAPTIIRCPACHQKVGAGVLRLVGTVTCGCGVTTHHQGEQAGALEVPLPKGFKPVPPKPLTGPVR